MNQHCSELCSNSRYYELPEIIYFDGCMCTAMATIAGFCIYFTHDEVVIFPTSDHICDWIYGNCSKSHTESF